MEVKIKDGDQMVTRTVQPEEIIGKPDPAAVCYLPLFCVWSHIECGLGSRCFGYSLSRPHPFVMFELQEL